MEDVTTTAPAGDAVEPSSAQGGDDTDSNPVDDLMARLRGKFGEQPGLGASRVDEDSETPAADADAKAPDADNPAEEPAPAKVEPEKKTAPAEEQRIELELGRAKHEARKLTAEVVTWKQKATELEKQAAEVKSALESVQKQFREGNPLKAMEELVGKPFAEIMQRAAKGEFDDKVPSEVRAKLKEIEDWKAQVAAREKADAEAKAKAQREAQQAELRAKDVVNVKKLIESTAEEFPFFATGENSAEALVDLAYQEMERTGKAPDLRKLIASVEDEAVKDFSHVLTNEKSLNALLAKNPLIKTALTKAIGFQEQSKPVPASSAKGTQAAKPPSTLAHATEVPSRSEHELSEDEERAERLRLYRSYKEQGLL